VVLEGLITFLLFVKLEKASNNFGNSNFNSLVLKLVIILNVSYIDDIPNERLARRGRHPCHLTQHTTSLPHDECHVLLPKWELGKGLTTNECKTNKSSWRRKELS